MNRSTLFLLGSAWILGCRTDSAGCGSPGSAAGSWTYTGSQTSPTAALSGTLTLTKTGTCTVAGTLMLTVDEGSGTPVTSSWTTSGDFLDDSIIELSAVNTGVERYHLGTLRTDTLAGTWNVTSGGATSGTFRAVRSGP